MQDLPEGGDWLATGSHTFCPECESPEVHVRIQLVPDNPQGSLAGVQMKLAMHEQWVFFCRACGATGPAEQRESVTQRVARGEHVEGHDSATCKACGGRS